MSSLRSSSRRRAHSGWLLAALLGGPAACIGHIAAQPVDWQHPVQKGPRVQSATSSPPVTAAPAIDDALAVDDELRHLVPPPSVCFSEPKVCGLDVAEMSLAALRPAEEHLERLVQAWDRHHTEWSERSALLHCEAMSAWRPSAGARCVRDLAAHGGLDTEVRRLQLLNLLDVLGPAGVHIALEWLTNDDVAVRRDLARWFASRALDDGLVAPLLGALGRERDPVAGEWLIRTFSTLLDARAVPALSATAARSEQLSARIAALDTLVPIVGPSLTTFLSRIESDNPEVQAAIARAQRHIEEEQAGVDPFQLSSSWGAVSMQQQKQVGGAAFLEDFKARRERPLQFLNGEVVNREELDRLFDLLIDGGGYGLIPVRSTIAVSAGSQDLVRIVELRRAIYAAGLPNRDQLAAEVTQVGRIIRVHHALRRPTRYWRTRALASGDELRFHP